MFSKSRDERSCSAQRAAPLSISPYLALTAAIVLASVAIRNVKGTRFLVFRLVRVTALYAIHCCRTPASVLK
jgi:hypothetical protein